MASIHRFPCLLLTQGDPKVIPKLYLIATMILHPAVIVSCEHPRGRSFMLASKSLGVIFTTSRAGGRWEGEGGEGGGREDGRVGR